MGLFVKKGKGKGNFKEASLLHEQYGFHPQDEEPPTPKKLVEEEPDI